MKRRGFRFVVLLFGGLTLGTAVWAFWPTVETDMQLRIVPIDEAERIQDEEFETVVEEFFQTEVKRLRGEEGRKALERARETGSSGLQELDSDP